MTEEIIIDGVNVAECGYFCEADSECSICGMGTDGEDTFCKNCKDNPNCYYKQLKRLEFELKITKADYEASEQENKELKETIKQYCQWLNEEREDNDKLQKVYQNDHCDLLNYRSALEEIREKAQHCIRQDICALCDYSKECAVPDADGLVYDNNKLLIKLINEVLQ